MSNRTLMVWKDQRIHTVQDIRDTILSIDNNNNLKDFVTAVLQAVPDFNFASFVEWLLARSNRCSVGEPGWLGTIECERLKLTAIYAKQK